MVAKQISIDGDVYNVESLSKDGQILTKKILFSRERIKVLTNNHALLTKAKNAYIADLSADIVQGRSGVDLGDLLSDD